jgi:hypothetical protein
MTDLRQRIPRIRDPRYLSWLRRRLCAVCSKPPLDGRPSGIEAAHLRAANMIIGKEHSGKSEKPHDKWASPLCHSCHAQQHAWGDELGWWVNLKIEPFKLCEDYYRTYRGCTGAPEAEVQRYRKKRKRDKTPKKPPRKIQNRSQPWPTRKFPKHKKRATK